jgi:hypothetical protein
MNPKERERLVDSVLDRALRPQLVEPRPGLEERILANLPTQPQRRPWWQWMWIPALAAAALLAVVIGMRVMHRELPAPVQAIKTVEAPKQEATVEPEAPAIKQLQPQRAHPPARVQVARVTPALPKQGVFPSPVPMTDQERLLLALVRRNPEQAKAIAVEQQAERERIQKYLERGDSSDSPSTAQQMR